jgi:hypothetical protein
MYLALSASKDAYITNKIIGSSFRATDANLGQAGTLDLFKLYDENSVVGETNPIELSRALIKFDYSPLRSLMSSKLDINDSSFKCNLVLSDVYGGQITPTNFKLIVFPLSRSFDEGVGRDVVGFRDIDVCNFLTASVSSGQAEKWYTTGANKQGLLGSNDIDIISSGNLNDGNGTVNLWREQLFSTGEEDLNVDITAIVSGTLAGLIPDEGFRISYSGSQETDEFTRFVKRFTSRNATNVGKRPKIVVTYNDLVRDNHNNFFFNESGSLLLSNNVRGTPRNIVSGTLLTDVKGADCMILTLKTGSFVKQFDVSQLSYGQNYITGVYKVDLLLNSFEDPTVRSTLVSSSSIEFTEIWGSNDGTVGYQTGSLTVYRPDTEQYHVDLERLTISMTNMRTAYNQNEMYRFRLFIEDITRQFISLKLPYENKGVFVDEIYYQVRDTDLNEVIIPFHNPGTAVSNDTSSHYFDFNMVSLPRGRTYTFDFKILREGSEVVFKDVAAKFRVD